jgi:predicted negative regulator of RcsB-dependent stress response
MVLLLTILIIATIGIVGYYVWNKTHSSSQNQQTQSVVQSSDSAPQIKSSSDLDSANNAIDKIDVSNNTNALNDIERSLNSL